MSVFIFVRYRSNDNNNLLETLTDDIDELVIPNFSGKKNPIYDVNLKKNEEILILNPSQRVKNQSTSLVVGSLSPITENDFKGSTSDPVSFTVLIKSSEEKVLVKSGILASRTVWYHVDKKKFIVSSSQRAITALIEQFDINEQALSWFLSTGLTGPGNSWNKKIKWLGPKATLELNSNDWSVNYSQNYTAYRDNELKRSEKKKLLLNHLVKVFTNISADDKSLVTLSGGSDSRLIASLIKRIQGFNIDTVTWGDLSKINIQNGDISIARKTAKYLGLQNKVFDLTPREDDNTLLENFFKNYVFIGGGRIDHFAGYLDNFKLWKELSKEYNTVLRGDEVFGWLPVYSESDVRVMLSYHQIGIYRNMKTLREYGLPKMNFPAWLERTKGESLQQWRDRLFNYHNISTKQASLQDLKYPFIETLNPLIHKSIVELTRIFSDSERTNKTLYLETIKQLIPHQIPFAEVSTMPSINTFVSRSENLDYIKDTLNSHSLNNLVGKKILGECKIDEFSFMKYRTSGNEIKTFIKKIIPLPLKKYLKKNMDVHYLPKEKLVLRLVLLDVIKSRYERDSSFLKDRRIER